MNTTVTLSGNGYNKSIKQSVNSASDIFSFTNLPSGTYTVEGTTTLRVKSGSGPATFCAHNSGSTSEVTKQVTIGSGGVSSVSLSFTCNNSSGGIIPSYTCSDGGYYSSVPSGQTCDTVDYKGLMVDIIAVYLLVRLVTLLIIRD